MALIFSLLFVRVEDLLQVMLFTTAAACLIGVLVLLFVREHFRLFLSLFFGLLAGCLWCFGYTIFAWQPAQQYDNQEGLVRLELTEYAESHTSYGTAYGVVTELNGQSRRIKVKAYLQDGSPAFAPGDVLRFHGKLFAVERSFRSNLLQEGYFLTLSQQGQAEAMFGEAKTPLRSMRILSDQIAEQIQTLLPEQEGALLAALLSGNQQGFSDAFEQALTVSGTRHITAVSGLHVSILAGILMQFFGKRAGLLLSIPAAITYAALVGFTPSVVRAVILLVFWAAAFWLKQEKDALTAMAAALLVLGRKKGRRIAVLGDMLELGDCSWAEHYRIGRIAAENTELIFAYGPTSGRVVGGAITGGMDPQKARSFETHEDMARALKAIARPGDVLLFKGSHGMHMEKVLELFLKEEK